MIAAPLYTQPVFRRVAGTTWRPGGLALTRRGLALCAFPVGARLLDIGCGAGASLRLLQALGYRAFGLDTTPVPETQGLPCVCASLAALPFATASFDGLLCECVLSLQNNLMDALRAMHRILRPQGRLLLSDLFRSTGQTASSDHVSSCVQGARPLALLHDAFQQAGFTLVHEEDHSSRLHDLAARLVWTGGTGAATACSCGSRGYGYGLWILERKCV